MSLPILRSFDPQDNKLTILSNGDRDCSIMSFRCRRPDISSRIGKPMRKPKKSLVAIAPVSYLLPIMLSTALVQNPTACAPRLSTVANAHSGQTPHQPDLVIADFTKL